MDYVLSIVSLVLLYMFFFWNKWKSQSRQDLTLNSLMYIYVGIVLFVTLMPFATPLGELKGSVLHTINLIPFRDLMRGYAGAQREIFLNMVMMMPFGFLYPIIKGKKMFHTVGMTLLFSLTIESAQLVNNWWGGRIPRLFDVTDLMTNTAGGALGYLIFLVLGPVFLNRWIK